MIKKQIAILIIISLIFLELYFKFISNMITGFSTIILSIGEKEEGCIQFLDVPPYMTRYVVTHINVGIWNCGSVELTRMNIVVNITNGDNVTITGTNRTVFNMNLDEKRTIDIPWNVTPSQGIYTLSVYGEFNESISDIASTQIVISPPSVVELPSPPGSFPSQEKIINITINYPKEINMTPDSEYIVLIKVINTGNTKIHNLNLKLESSDIQTQILPPSNFSILDKGSFFLFTTKFKASAEIRTGTYYVKLYVSSDEISENGKITINVRTLALKEEAAGLIAYYSTVINTLDDDIKKAENEGKNVTEARNLLSDAKKELDIAKNLFNLDMYQSSIDQIENVKAKIIEVVRAIVTAPIISKISKPIIIPAMPMVPCLFWIIVMIIVDVIVIITTKKMKLHWTITILILLTVLIVIVLISGASCLSWLIIITLLMILIVVMTTKGFREQRTRLISFSRW